MIFTDKTKQAFDAYKPWYFGLLPIKYKLLIQYRWMVTKGCIEVVIWTNDNIGFDYTVVNPNKNIDKVYTGRHEVTKWDKSFDNNIHKALHIANMLYNNNNLIEIPRQFV